MTQSARSKSIAFWELSFRPFFLLGATFGAIAILLWALFLSGKFHPAGPLEPYLWHPHEMIYGFAGAIVAGFVLTAAQNWSGVPSIRGLPLQLLVLVWLLARVLLLTPDFPFPLAAIFDLSFFPLVSVFLWRHLKIPELRTERVFFVFFLLLFAGNSLVHLDSLGWFTGYARHGLFLGLDTILLIIIFMGGRVIPFFTESSIARKQPRTYRGIEVATLSLSALFLALDVSLPGSHLHGIVALLAGGANLARLLAWQVRRVRRVPLIWVLHAAYLWLVIGFFLSGLASFGILAASLATHAFTVGGLGVVIHGMISRVSLGHTGRRLHPRAWTVAAYIFLNLAAVIRVFLPMANPGALLAAWILSAICWVIAFALFVVIYAPILIAPRADGRPG